VLDIVSLLNEADTIAFKNNREAAYMPQWLPLFLNPLHRSSGNVKYHLKKRSRNIPYSETLKKQIDVSFRNPWFSLLEGVLSRSDSKVADLVLLAWKKEPYSILLSSTVNISFGSQHGKSWAWIPWST